MTRKFGLAGQFNSKLESPSDGDEIQMAKLGTATWRLWLGLGLVALGTLSAALSVRIGSTMMLIFLALSVLIALVSLVQFSGSRLGQESTCVLTQYGLDDNLGLKNKL